MRTNPMQTKRRRESGGQLGSSVGLRCEDRQEGVAPTPAHPATWRMRPRSRADRRWHGRSLLTWPLAVRQ
jgi:hypothetical protein